MKKITKIRIQRGLANILKWAGRVFPPFGMVLLALCFGFPHNQVCWAFLLGIIWSALLEIRLAILYRR